jgi:DNA polymerase/3'-5' exonuclease PolX
MPDNLERVRLETIEPIATAIASELAEYCERIEIAGSIRRRLDYVGDIELVVIPRHYQRMVGLFDDLPAISSTPPVDCLDEAVERLRLDGVVCKRPDTRGRLFWGRSDKRLLWKYGVSSLDWAPVDIFGATAETWGAKMVLRTGPWQFSKRLVTHVTKGGVLARDLEFHAGGLYRYVGAHRRFVPTPDEAALFDALGLPYVPPEQRTASTFEGFRREVPR